MKIKEIKIIKSVLSKEIGWLWPIFLARCLIRKNAIFKKTHCAKIKNAESELAKRLSLVAISYIELKAKSGKEKAFEIMRKIIVPIGCNEPLALLQSLNISRKKPMELLISYLDLVDKKGVGRFGNMEYVKRNNNICHRVVTKCPFYNFFTEAGTSELTKLFCEVDKEFYSKAFPELKFHRGSSWENTIAYGKDHCEFIFEKNK